MANRFFLLILLSIFSIISFAQSRWLVYPLDQNGLKLLNQDVIIDFRMKEYGEVLKPVYEERLFVRSDPYGRAFVSLKDSTVLNTYYRDSIPSIIEIFANDMLVEVLIKNIRGNGQHLQNKVLNDYGSSQPLVFEDCKINGAIAFHNLSMEYLDFARSKIDTLLIYSGKLDRLTLRGFECKRLLISSTDINENLTIDSNSKIGDFELYSPMLEELLVHNTEFTGDFSVNSDNTTFVNITQCSFQPEAAGYDDFLKIAADPKETHQFLVNNSIFMSFQNAKVFVMMNCQFGSAETGITCKPLIISGTIGTLLLKGNSFYNPLWFQLLSVSETMEIKRNEFMTPVWVYNTVFPEHSFEFDYSQFQHENKLVYLTINSINDEAKTSNSWGTTMFFEDDLGDNDGFRGLVKLYSYFYSQYRNHGDIDQANLAYRDLQTLYTKKHRFEYQTKGGLESFFRWRLNQIMDWYVDYGTSPAKALVVSFYILMVFAIFYFFYPSEWDHVSKEQLWVEIGKTMNKKERNLKTVVRAIYLLFLAFINAFTLSINSFVTLGFGQIPTKGLARYVCIFQGFLGWFLLSLFSVALINQVLF